MTQNTQLQQRPSDLSTLIEAKPDESNPLGKRNSWHRGLASIDGLAELKLWDVQVQFSTTSLDIDETIQGNSICSTSKDISEPLQHMLQVAACLGSFDNFLLGSVLSPSTNISQLTREAVDRSLIAWNPEQECYLFSDCNVESAFYKQAGAKQEHAEYHLALGRLLVQNLSSQQLESKHYYTILRQFHLGRTLILDERERSTIASLCLQGGAKAVSSSDFVAASNYLDLGIGLLGENHWETEYELSLALFNAAAEVEYCIARYERSESLISEILQHGKCYQDMLHASATNVYLLGSRYKVAEALKEGLAVLRRLGHKFPSRPRAVHVVVEFLRTRRLLGKRSNEWILRLPLVTDPEVIAAAQMLNLLFLSAYQTDPNLYVLLVLRLVRLTIVEGLSAVSSVAFSVYSTLVCSLSNNKDEGYRYGKLSMALLEKFQANEWLPRVYLTAYGNTFTYTHPLRECISQLSRAHEVGMGSGDIEFAMLSANACSFFQICAGDALPKVEEEAAVFYNQMISHNMPPALLLMRPGLQLIHNLRGKSDNPLNLNGSMWNATDDNASIMESRDALTKGCFHFHLVLVSFVFNDFLAAESHAKHLEKLIHPPYLHPGFSCLLLFRGLATLASSGYERGLAKRRSILIARRCLKSLKNYARIVPTHCASKADLLEADISAATGKADVARGLFSSAISKASHDKDLFVLSVSYERAARFVRARGDGSRATEFLKQAHASYRAWGALAKVTSLENEFPCLL